MAAPTSDGFAIDRELEDVFALFAGFGNRTGPLLLDGAKFSKLCRDCGLLERYMETATVDIVFSKAKPRGERKLDFAHFLSALDLLAKEKFPGDVDGPLKVRQLVINNQGPTATATVVATDGIFAKLTDSRLYTGAHRHRFDEEGHGRGVEGRDLPAMGEGTNSSYHGGPVSDLSLIMREGMRGGTFLASATAAKKDVLPSPRSPRHGDDSFVSPASARSSCDLKAPDSAASGGGSGSPRRQARFNSTVMASADGIGAANALSSSTDLFQMYMTFCVFGNTSGSVEEMDGSHFAKLCKECHIQGKHIPAASVDIVFNKVKTPGRRTINFEQFKMALLLLSRERFPKDEPESSMQAFVSLVVNCGGPVVTTATPPTIATGIFDRLTDSRLYTGAHKHRFDDSGHGRGIEGREDRFGRARSGKVDDLSLITRSHLS